jgi:hypothetical protein
MRQEPDLVIQANDGLECTRSDVVGTMDIEFHVTGHGLSHCLFIAKPSVSPAQLLCLVPVMMIVMVMVIMVVMMVVRIFYNNLGLRHDRSRTTEQY